MNSNLEFQTMGQTPSPLGMPIYGSTLGIDRTATICATRVSADSDRHVAALVVKGAFPGTSAWRPPTC